MEVGGADRCRRLQDTGLFKKKKVFDERLKYDLKRSLLHAGCSQQPGAVHRTDGAVYPIGDGAECSGRRAKLDARVSKDVRGRSLRAVGDHAAARHFPSANPGLRWSICR